MSDGALLDTSFFLRFLNEEDPLFNSAEKYYQYFLGHRYKLYISTISIAEYCVKGSIEELPLRNLIILPFNILHAKRAGEFAGILYNAHKKKELIIKERPIIINDAKLFAQTDTEPNIKYFVTSDKRSIDLYQKLIKECSINYQIVNVYENYTETFGVLGLDNK